MRRREFLKKTSILVAGYALGGPASYLMRAPDKSVDIEYVLKGDGPIDELPGHLNFAIRDQDYQIRVSAKKKRFFMTLIDREVYSHGSLAQTPSGIWLSSQRMEMHRRGKKDWTVHVGENSARYSPQGSIQPIALREKSHTFIPAVINALTHKQDVHLTNLTEKLHDSVLRYSREYDTEVLRVDEERIGNFSNTITVYETQEHFGLRFPTRLQVQEYDGGSFTLQDLIAAATKLTSTGK